MKKSHQSNQALVFLYFCLFTVSTFSQDHLSVTDSLDVVKLVDEAKEYADTDPSKAQKLLDSLRLLLEKQWLPKYPEQKFLKSIEARSLYFLAYYKRRENKFDEALNFLQQSLDIRNEIKEIETIPSSWHQISWLWIYQFDFEKAKKYLDSAYHYSQKYKTVSETIKIYSTYGAIYGSHKDLKNKLEDYDKAAIYFKKALKLADSLGVDSEIAASNSNYAAFLRRQNKIGENIPYLEKSIKLHEKENNLIGLESGLFSLGVSYRKLGQPYKAIEYYKKAIELSLRLNNEALLPFRYLGLSLSYETVKDYKNAYLFYVKYKKALDKRNDIETIRKVADLDSKYKYEKQAAIDSIQFTANMQIATEKVIRESNKKVFILTIIFLLLLSIAIIGYLLYRQRTIRAERSRVVAELDANRKETQNELLKKEIDSKKIEIVNLMAESIERVKNKAKLLENLKKISRTDSEGNLNSILAELKSEKVEDYQLLTIREKIKETNPDFSSNLKSKYPELTKTELEMCALIRAGLTSNEIASLRNTTIHAVKKTRTRLIKKFQLPSDITLADYIRGL